MAKKRKKAHMGKNVNQVIPSTNEIETFTLRIPEHLNQKLQTEAAKIGVSRNALVCFILHEYFRS